MSLASKLKKIYTEGDQYTVLQLLHALIKAVEQYETEEHVTSLYLHTLTVSIEGEVSTFTVKILTDSPSVFGLITGGPTRYASEGRILAISGITNTLWGTYYDDNSIKTFTRVLSDGNVNVTIASIVQETVTAL